MIINDIKKGKHMETTIKIRMMIKILGLFVLVLVLASCDIPKLFWEEEVRQVVDDVVTEEEKLNHYHDHPTNR